MPSLPAAPLPGLAPGAAGRPGIPARQCRHRPVELHARAREGSGGRRRHAGSSGPPGARTAVCPGAASIRRRAAPALSRIPAALQPLNVAPLRVAVDGRSLGGGRTPRGIATYLRYLLAELQRSSPGQYELFEGSRLTHAAGAVLGRPRLDRLAGPHDVVWAPSPAPLAISRDTPLVLTIHDLSFEHYPEDYSSRERLFHRLARPRALAARATRVIAVSNYVRNQLLSEWSLDPAKVTAIPSGPGRPPSTTPLSSQVPAVNGVSPPYLLAVGSLEPRKGTELLLDAHALAKARGLRAQLVLAGEGSVEAAPGVTALGYVLDDRMDALYAGALALVCPSREEGFGFTPLEALARGTPAIVSDLPPLRETLGDAALRFPPGHAGALADAMLRLEADPELGRRLVAAAKEPLARLSWRRAAEELRAVFAEAARGRGATRSRRRSH